MEPCIVKLPIDVVLGTSPPKFEYYQTVSSPSGTRSLKHVACAPPAMEAALVDLVNIAKQLAAENEKLKRAPK